MRTVIKSKEDIAELLEIDITVLNYYLLNRADKYREFTIPKRDGRPRIIHTPSIGLKIIQRKILHIMELWASIHENAHGFVREKSILSNAALHCKRKHILNIDLKDFFHSVSFPLIERAFQNRIELPSEAARTLARLVCMQIDKKGFLPQGAPSSPFIANFVAYDFDQRLTSFAEKYHCRYSRYADDITISNDEAQFPRQIAYKDLFGDVWLSTRFAKIVENSGFHINYRKVRLRGPRQRKEVTGLIVNGKQPTVKRSYIRNLQAVIHNWETKGYSAVQNKFLDRYSKKVRHTSKPHALIEDHVRGKLDFLAMVRGQEDALYRSLRIRFEKLHPPQAN